MSEPVFSRYPGSDTIGPERKFVNVVTTAGAVSLTASQVYNGIYRRDPNGAGRSDVLPTARSIVAMIPDAKVGSFFTFIVRNEADAAETITLTESSSGITLLGTMTIAQSVLCTFIGYVTAVGATPTITLMRGPQGTT